MSRTRDTLSRAARRLGRFGLLVLRKARGEVFVPAAERAAGCLRNWWTAVMGITYPVLSSYGHLKGPVTLQQRCDFDWICIPAVFPVFPVFALKRTSVLGNEFLDDNLNAECAGGFIRNRTNRPLDPRGGGRAIAARATRA